MFSNWEVLQMKKSLSARLSVIFTGIIIAACLILVGTCAGIFKFTETTIKDIRYEDILDGYKTEVKSQVQSGITIVKYYYDQFQNGQMDEETAKTNALETLRNFRYGDEGDGYIWVDSTDYTLVMHPILPDQEGSNRKELKDNNGVMIIQEIMKAAEKGGGFNEFIFTKSDGKTQAPKIAYSEEFEPWNWVLTTGCYTDDINANIEASANTKKIEQTFRQDVCILIAEGIILIIAMIFLTYFVARRLVKVLDVIRGKLENISSGKLTGAVDSNVINRQDELGAMVRNANESMEKFGDIIKDSMSISQSVTDAGDRLKDMTDSAHKATGQIADAIEGIAAEATHQAEAIGQMHKTITDIQSGEDEIASATENINQCTETLRENSGNMKHHIEAMSKGSAQMTDNVSTIASRIAETNQTIEKMSEILSSIEEIASETNLLALNASIEAARAGEAGKGFAVVAESIKGLSENTSNELERIKTIITSLVNGFEECAKCIDLVVNSNQTNIDDTSEVITSFSLIEDGISETNEKVARISSIVLQTMSEIHSVSEQVEKIEGSAQSTAAASQQVTATTQELAAHMNEVENDISGLTAGSHELAARLNTFEV